MEYADMLNRIRIGEQTNEDFQELKKRVRPENHPDLVGATYISCTNKTVNKLNEKRLNELSGELIIVEAINIHPTIRLNEGGVHLHFS